MDLNLNAVLPATDHGCVCHDRDDGGHPQSQGPHAPRALFLPWIALAGVVVTAGVCYWLLGQPMSAFQGMMSSDPFALGIDFVVLVAVGLGILLSVKYIPNINPQTGEYYALLLLISSGMMAMGAAMDLIVVFISLEIFSLGLYILSGLNRNDRRSSEAAMKYFLLGAFASAFFVYGAALLYGATGSTQFSQIAAALTNGAYDTNLIYPAIGLLIVGFGFKVSLVPFHMWTPDVYQGAPTPLTAFMSVGTKAAAFAAFYRTFLYALPSQQAAWGMALGILAVLTMTLGNLAALRQTSLKRLLAYSSIAHAGYILVGLAAGTPSGAEAAMYYLISYAFMNIGAFAVVIMLEKQGEMDASGERLRGLSKRAAGAGLYHGDLHVQPGGCAALCRLLCQVLRLLGGRAGRHGLAGGDRHAQQCHRRLLLSAHHREHVLWRARPTRPSLRPCAVARRRLACTLRWSSPSCSASSRCCGSTS